MALRRHRRTESIGIFEKKEPFLVREAQRSTTPFFEVLSNLSTLDSLHRLLEGKEVSKSLRRLSKTAVRNAEGEAEKIGMTEQQKQEFMSAVKEFFKDTETLYKIGRAVDADVSLNDAGFSRDVEEAIASTANSIASFCSDLSLILDFEEARNRISEIFAGLSAKTQLKDDREFFDGLSKDVKQGRYDDHIRAFRDEIFDEKTKIPVSFSKYVILNYREGSIFEAFSSLIWHSRIRGKDISETLSLLSNEELLLMPMTNPHNFSMMEYIETIKSAEKSAFDLEPSFVQTLGKLSIFFNITYRNAAWAIEKASLSSLEEETKALEMVNEGTLEDVKKGEISSELLLDFVLRSFKNKGISPVSDVVPGGAFFKGRTVDLFVNDLVEGTELRRVVAKWQPRITFNLERLFAGNKFVTASTDGDSIYVLPHVSYFNTRKLNNYFYFRSITHEKNHIDFGTFHINLDWDFKVDALRHLKGKLPQKVAESRKSLELLSALLTESLKTATDRLRYRIKGGKVTIMEFERELFKALSENAAKTEYSKDKLVKIFINILAKTNAAFLFHSICNIIEDYRIDNTFISLEEDETLDYGGDKEKFRKLKFIYRFMQYSLIFASATSYKNMFLDTFKEFKAEEREKKVDALNLLLFKTKLGPTLFNELFSDFEEDNLFSRYIESMTKWIVDYEDNEVVVERFSNRTLEASLEYFVLLLLFSDLAKEIPEMKGEKIGSGQSGSQQSQAGGPLIDTVSGKEGEQEGEEGKEGGSQEGEQEGEEGIVLSPLSDFLNKGKNGKLKQAVSEGHSRKFPKEKKARLVEQQQRTETMVLPKRLVMKYVSVLSKIYEGSIIKKVKYGNKGVEVEPKRLVSFIYKKVQKEADFLKKRYTEIVEEGSDLRQRPITIYVGIDSSGSMDQNRMEKSVVQALSLFAAFNKLRPMMREANINLKLVSMATEDGIILSEHDAENFTFEDRGDSVVASFSFNVVGGGTDLVGMIESFRKRIEDIEDETEKLILKGAPRINPSILIVYFTDFGDNAGDSSGVANAIESFAEFAERYRRRSRIVHGGYSDTGISLVYAAPDVDDMQVFNAAKRLLDESVVLLSSKDDESVAGAINDNVPVLLGLKATNIKKKDE